MKLKSLILGSVAAAGLSTAGFAADLGVLTSLDVCDSLGISGLTISSSDNCLQITGGVSYEFNWGDYGDVVFYDGNTGDVSISDDDGVINWDSSVEAWLKFVGTASSDFGPASATIKLLDEDVATAASDLKFDEAYVSIGDTTAIMAGKKSSIANKGDDEAFNFLRLFNDEAVDDGVEGAYFPATGGHVIQIVSDLGNGVKVKGGLEDLEDIGSAVGVLEYAGEGITAHATFMAGGILDGEVDAWGAHAGFTGTFDAFKVRAAAAYSYDVATANTSYNVLASAQATFDMFTIALSGDMNGGTVLPTQTGFGGSVGATVSEGVAINLGARWFDEDTSAADTEGYQIAAQLVVAVSETIKLTGEIGAYGTNKVAFTDEHDFYGAAELAWAPGGGFTSSIKGQVHSDGAYKVTFKAAKEFK